VDIVNSLADRLGPARRSSSSACRSPMARWAATCSSTSRVRRCRPP